jgi:hypothetical protein
MIMLHNDPISDVKADPDGIPCDFLYVSPLGKVILVLMKFQTK